MSNYTPPIRVISPKTSVSNVRPLLDRGADDWSAALLDWDGQPSCALRWNGSSPSPDQDPHPGNPQSRGRPTWFVIPGELTVPVLEAILAMGPSGPGIDSANAETLTKQAIETFARAQAQSQQGEGRLRELVREVVLEMKANGEI